MAAGLLWCAVALAVVAGAAAAGGSDVQWGTYRPHALISVRARAAHSPIFGVAWHSAFSGEVRHLAGDREEQVRSFSWRRHDGANYGEQDIVDAGLNLRLTTHFVRNDAGTGWALRVLGATIDPGAPGQAVSVVFYGAAGAETKGAAATTFKVQRKGASIGVVGEDAAFGALRATVHAPTSGSVSGLGKVAKNKGSTDASHTLLRTSAEADEKHSGLNRFFTAGVKGDADRAWMVEELLTQQYAQSGGDDAAGAEQRAPLRLGDGGGDASSLVFVQRVLRAPFSLDVTFGDMKPAGIDDELARRAAAFEERFEAAFALRARGVSAREVEFGKIALSNVLGGVGYWHGSSLAADGSERGVRTLPAIDLFTATPSRAAFPRGFLWDEGFHQLIVQRWDAALSEQCMRSWLGAMQDDGWIPREQILGVEAQARFPAHIRHLLVQKPDVANPPTLFLPLRVLAAEVSKMNVSGTAGGCAAKTDAEEDASTCRPGSGASDEAASAREYLATATRQLGVYFEWIRRTQAGPVEDTFRWRGRSSELTVQNGGYPLTLASGLDDYPRGDKVDDDERHVDLQAWMAWAAGALAEMARASGLDSEATRYDGLQRRYTDVLLKQYGAGVEDALCDHVAGKAECHEGYVTLLPFALGLVPVDSPIVSNMLDAISDPQRLRSVAGVRSLSRGDPSYRRGDDYWTGPVWQPFNFLVLAALHTKYAAVPGPYQARAQKIHDQLRQNVVDNALQVFADTGLLWENYDPESGAGRRGRQFTGWSSLVLLMLAERYEGVVA